MWVGTSRVGSEAVALPRPQPSTTHSEADAEASMRKVLLALGEHALCRVDTSVLDGSTRVSRVCG